MEKRLNRALDRIWMAASRHCQRYRLSDPARERSIEELRELARQMIEIFEADITKAGEAAEVVENS